MFAVGIGLIAWRGDRLRSPGGIDSPISREGAFVLNNLLFSTFAFIVLLGTVFPLLYEAFRGQQVTVGSPYFDTMTVPLGLALLTLMAVGSGSALAKDDGVHPSRPADDPGLCRRRGGRDLRRGRIARACATGGFRFGIVGSCRQRPAARDLGPVSHGDTATVRGAASSGVRTAGWSFTSGS